MFEIKSEATKKYLSLLIMLIVAALAVLVVGEACKYILPKDTVFFFTVNKIYFLAAGTLLLAAGLNMLSLNGLRNLAALFVGLLVLVVVLFYLDKLACTALWGGAFTSVLQRVPTQYVDMFYKALDWLSVILAACGLLLLLIKGLDLLKDALTGAKKA